MDNDDIQDILGGFADSLFRGAAQGVARSVAERAFQAQEDEEFVEIGSDGTVSQVNPHQKPKGVMLRDGTPEY